MRASVLCLLLCASCAGTAQERQLSKLTEELNRVQHENEAMSERIATLEVDASRARSEVEREKKAPPPTPQLRVVHLGNPEVEAKPDDTEDLQPRPTIRIQGSRAKGAQPIIEQTIPDENTPPIPGRSDARPSALDPEARKAYDSALALVNERQYDKALDAFSAFLVRYPDHPYADNATYWRGECYFAKGEYARALEQFEGLVARFPLGNKVPDALLKAGIAQQKLGNPQKAGAYFDKLRREYPKSDAAKRIPTSTSPMGSQVAP